ncbi:MAG: hypothetical protein FK734_01010 [Asgard group archaeon]|nr:hypothetical protein [Asgard group archaeon]
MALQTDGLIIPRGMVLPLSLYHINGGSLGSAKTLVDKLNEHPIEFKDRKYYEGFDDADTDGSMISVYYTIGQPITVQRMQGDELTTQVVYSQGRCEYIIHVKDKFLECRGTSWVAKKGLAPLMNILGVEFERVRINDDSMIEMCRDASMVKTIQISEIEDPALSQIQLNGNIMESAEWTVYRRRGVIRYFRGYLVLPTGGQLSAQVTNKGTMLIYKTREGIPAKDVIAAVDMVKKLTKN